MTYDDKTSIAHIAGFWVFMLLILSEWVFGWPTEQHLFYFAMFWLVAMIVTALYGYHLESKD